MAMDENDILRWYDLCRQCKKQKPNMPKARCQLYHSVCVVKSPTALDSIHLFKDKYGNCKMFEPKGDTGDESERERKKRQAGPASWR
jgi:hypothetical protein